MIYLRWVLNIQICVNKIAERKPYLLEQNDKKSLH